jgi:hypothetical protein
MNPLTSIGLLEKRLGLLFGMLQRWLVLHPDSIYTLNI